MDSGYSFKQHAKFEALRLSAGFTIAELSVAAGAGVMLLVATVGAMMGLQKTFDATRRFSMAQTTQSRLIDYISTDLRRAVRVGWTTSNNPDDLTGSETSPMRNDGTDDENLSLHLNKWQIKDGTFDDEKKIVNGAHNKSEYLTLKLPGYYRSDKPSEISSTPAADYYHLPQLLINFGGRVCYGKETTQAPEVFVIYRKAYSAVYGSECYMRREIGYDSAGNRVTTEIVVGEKMEYTDLQILAKRDETFVCQTWFHPFFSQAGGGTEATLTSSDRVFMRNPRLD